MYSALIVALTAINLQS